MIYRGKKIRRKFTTWFLGLFILLLTVSSYAQKENIRFKRISIEEGLSQVSVFCILQDSKGFMWFGTQDGLNRYDGYEFKIYRHDPRDSTAISDNYIWSICEDSAGILWIGTNVGGLNKFNPKTGKFTHYNTKNNKLSHDRVMSICKDKAGVIWIGTEGGGLNKLDPKTGEFEHYTKNNSNLSHNDVRSVFKDSSGTIWVGTADGLNKFDPQTGKFITYKHKKDNPNRFSFNKVMCIYEDHLKVLWIGTEEGGLNKFDPKTGEFSHYTTDKSSLSHNDVRAIYEDKNKTLWVGTRGGGLNAFDRNTGSFTHYTPDARPHSLSHNDVRSIYEDKSGILWVGTRGKGLNMSAPTTGNFEHYENDASDPNSLSHNTVLSFYECESGEMWIGTHGGGLNKFDIKSGKFTRYQYEAGNKNSIGSNIVWSIYEDKSGVLWVGTYGGGLNKMIDREKERFESYKHNDNKPHSLSHNDVRTIYEDRSGMLWIGTDGGGLNLFDREEKSFKRYQHEPNAPQSLSDNWVLFIIEDSSGRLWIGTRNGGLNRLDDRKTMRFTHYKHDPTNEHSLSHNSVLNIYEDSSGVLWIGTYDGLNKLIDHEEGIFKSYREKDGLPNNTIYAILEDNKGNLWLSTNKGLSRFNPEKKDEAFRNYDVEDGLQSNEFNGASCIKTKKGELFFGGVNGFNAFFPENIKEDPYPPPIVITDFLLANQSVLPQIKDKKSPLKAPINETDALTLSYRDNIFSFKFSALHYASPKKNKYEYRLEGYDNLWIKTDWRNRRATYTNLPGGDYVFRVKGTNKDGKGNEDGTSITLKILPPPWKTWWAYSLYGLVGIGILVLLFSVWSQKKKADYEHKVVQKLQELDKLKDDFLSRTSHELRTPLNGIIGLTESLIDGAAGPVNQKLVANLSAVVLSGKRLSNLVNDILDFSQVKNKSLNLRKKPVDLRALTEVVLTLSRPLIGGKKLELVNEIDQGVPLVDADENRLQQIIYNLVGNAIKFTGSGSVRVSAEVKEKMLHVQVSDTGIGIPEEKLKLIFEPFEQAEGSVGRPYGGTGIGLTITRQLVELHGGEIWVKSSVGKGSTFTFTIPISQSGEKILEMKVPEAPSISQIPLSDYYAEYLALKKYMDSIDIPKAGNFHILVVDDDPVNRQVIFNLLGLQNYTVTEASSGHETLDVLDKDQRFDLILLDTMMPRMSGYEVCRKIRKRFPAHELPVIFLTARNNPADRIAAFESGGNDFIAKPVDKGELLAHIRSHLQLLEANRKLAKEHQKLKETQSQLIQAEKMASLGTLLAGVAHELNNPAAFIMMNSEFFAKAWKDVVPILDRCSKENENLELAGISYKKSKEEINKLITGLLEGSQRIKKMTEDLKNFSKKEDPLKKEEIDINKAIQASINLTHNMIKNATNRFTCDLNEDVPFLYGSFQRLEQVFINLIQNACQALPDNTRGIYISTAYDREKNEIIVKVKDEGVGIDENNMNRIMDPFFTTKRDMGGTGLGLAISMQIIQEHGGKINFESKPGKGTTAYVYLPVEPLR